MRNVKTVKVGNNVLNGKKIYIQSMLNKRSDDIKGNVEQAIELEKAGCDIVRAAIPDMEAIKLIPAIKEKVKIPLVADIHFDYRLALAAADAGIDKIRINPGNIGDMDRVKQVAVTCANKNIPIRIGVNSGSLEKEILERYGSPTPEALVESALGHVKLLERFDFDSIVISIKSSNVKNMIDSYRLAALKCSYPLHLGVTEAGTERMGIIKSSAGIGSLLCDEIGETIRVSLTGDPVSEIYAAKDILKAVGKGSGVEIISCPTCGRTRIDLVKAAKLVEDAVKDIDKNIKVAIAGGDKCAVLFKKGQIIKKINEEDILPELMKEIEKL